MAREPARPAGRGAPDLRGDASAQMMLLTAIVLLIGFIALAGMVSRVSLLTQQAGREQDRPLLREVEPLQRGLNAALDPAASGKGLGSMGLTPGTAAWDAGVQGVLQHVRQLEAERGFIARWTLECDGGLTSNGFATFTISDGELKVTLKSKVPGATGYFARPTCTTLSG
ncbi:MAG TPA: hypothetical protein VM286_06795 [Candidatus Thermoplasmatota archaeon]|nr:hypothetical protein [Candidatus Thermoplasmatota archaeon]